jgi:phosphatidylglycerol lysyltransferase
MIRSAWRPIGLFILLTGLAIAAWWLGIFFSLWTWLAIGPIVFVWACVLALAGRPSHVLETADGQRCQARKIVQAYGHSSMAHLALLDDKDYFFSLGGSLIAFTVVDGVAVTLGDPIGPAQDAEPAIMGYCQLCAQNGWLPAFGLTSAEYLEIYQRHHFRKLCLGHEGILDLNKFTLKGNANKTFRKRYNRLSEQGYKVKVIEPPIPDTILCQLRQVSDEWLKMVHAAEKQFFLALFDEAYIRGERIAAVYSPQEAIIAFVNLVPEYQLNEVSIDLMRRSKHVESGTMDFLFVSLFLWARQQGYDTFNLGLSPLFGVGDSSKKPWIERLIHLAYEHGGFYDFKGLNGFKIKFHPRWQPQYLIYPGRFSLVRVGLALAKINAGAGETLWQYFKSHPKRTSPDET